VVVGIDPGIYIILWDSIWGRRERGFVLKLDIPIQGCCDDEIEEHGAAALRGFVKWGGN
jgi:hypothetical protein